ncbi:hypothetical protein GCM10011413_11070 [Pedobacter psychrotolerans]|uniref:Uncharacterized protein n=1 Tax=Pedobacter psychrotolerans TaxID=1843235 RepID=A0ABQ1SPW1_9SPHI|nr:hypothetical protein GCM10011413_11070 [Pedobacter psychrotolerans]
MKPVIKNDHCQLIRPDINVAIGTPKTVAIVSPENIIPTAFDLSSESEFFSAIDNAIDQYTGWKNAGSILTTNN